MTLKPKADYVQRRDEECDCAECGYPMYVGDRVWTIVEGSEIVDFGFCGRSCTLRAIDRYKDDEGPSDVVIRQRIRNEMRHDPDSRDELIAMFGAPVFWQAIEEGDQR